MGVWAATSAQKPMGAHGTLDDALAGVAASRRSPTPERRRRRRSRSRSRERSKKSSSHRHHKSHKKDRKKHRDSGGDDDDKRRHRHSHRHRSPPPPPPLSPRAATSAFLASFPEEAPSLRSVLAKLDAGTGLVVDGVPSPAARSALTALLTALGARPDAAGAYELPAGAPRALSVVGGVLGGGQEERVVVGPSGPPPPLVGPAAPPPEVLAAAAAAAAASSDDDGDEVGPAAPADAAADADAASSEVTRVLAAIDASPSRPDPYTVLGVPPSSSPATVRAALRRGALLTHPDKNDAPGAATAFAALAAAAAALRDPEGRASADAARAVAAEEAALKAFVAEERRKAEWRSVRGGGGPPPAPTTTTTRESWMTELPSVAGPAAPEAGRSVNAFSSRGVAEVDRAWGVNPGDAPAALRGPVAAAAAAAPAAPSVDAVFNAQHRGESLLAQHARRAAAAPPPAAAAAAPDATHPWTPWDREAAMAPQRGRRSVVADPATEAASLAGRFGKGGG